VQSRMSKLFTASLAAMALGACSSVASAALLFRVNVDTSAFTPGSYKLEFVVTDGSDGSDPTDIGNNTATITNFNFGGGSPGAPINFDPVTAASGDFVSGLVLSESDPLFASTVVTAPFTVGGSLQFDVDLTDALNVTGVNDSFQFRILDTNDVVLPTTDPFAIGTAVFVEISPLSDLDAIEHYDFTAPVGTVTVSVVPEPTTLGLLACGASLLLRRRRA
jgi:hypothetical protein